MPSVASVAACWLLPLGDAGDPEDRQGEAAMLSELALRGAGDRDSRAWSDALDRLGVQRSLSNSSRHLRLGAVMLGDRLDEALPLLVDLVRRPRLPADAIEPALLGTPVERWDRFPPRGERVAIGRADDGFWARGRAAGSRVVAWLPIDGSAPARVWERDPVSEATERERACAAALRRALA